MKPEAYKKIIDIIRQIYADHYAMGTSYHDMLSGRYYRPQAQDYIELLLIVDLLDDAITDYVFRLNELLSETRFQHGVGTAQEYQLTKKINDTKNWPIWWRQKLAMAEDMILNYSKQEFQDG